MPTCWPLRMRSIGKSDAPTEINENRPLVGYCDTIQMVLNLTCGLGAADKPVSAVDPKALESSERRNATDNQVYILSR